MTHPAYASEFPPSDDTLAGRMMMLLATGREDAIADLMWEALDDGEQLFPDDPTIEDLDEETADALRERVRDAYARAVSEPSDDVAALDAAAGALADRGIAWSHAEGWDAREAAEEGYAAARDLPEPRGYAYITVQDVERAVASEVLYIGYSDMSGEGGAEAVAVGESIVAELREAGLNVAWSGKASQRITLAGFHYAVPLDE